MNKEWKNFCPLWLYKIVISITVYDYVVRDIGIFVTQKKYTNFFAEMYDDLNQESIEEEITSFNEEFQKNIFPISAITGAGIDDLMNFLKEKFNRLRD